MKKDNFWLLTIIVLVIILAKIGLNKFGGDLEKPDILNFYSNLLVVFITIGLGVINYQQAKHIQEEDSKENEYLRKQNEKANRINEKLLDIIEHNSELEEQKNMPCLSICNRKVEAIGNDINLKFKNIGVTIIKCIDIEEIPEKTIRHGIGENLGLGIVTMFKMVSKTISNYFKNSVKETDFFEFFEHNIDIVGINEIFNLKATPKHIINKDGEEMDIVALIMKIENIYGKKYIQTIVILLEEQENNNRKIYSIKRKYIDIQVDKNKK